MEYMAGLLFYEQHIIFLKKKDERRPIGNLT